MLSLTNTHTPAWFHAEMCAPEHEMMWSGENRIRERKLWPNDVTAMQQMKSL